MLKDALAGGADIPSPYVPGQPFEEIDMRTTLVAATAFAIAVAATPAAWAQGAAAADGTNVGALLAQAKTPHGKKALVASTLSLTDAEAKKFWPVYDAYQRKLEANNRRYSRAVEDVVMTGKPISDAYATSLARELTEIEDAEARARKSLYSGAVKALPGRKAVRYLQLESKLQSGYRYEVASALPLIK
jgi:Spy/CpxP family protein refolding chaperone